MLEEEKELRNEALKAEATKWRSAKRRRGEADERRRAENAWAAQMAYEKAQNAERLAEWTAARAARK